MAKLQLYHYYRSSCSWRVRWALKLKGVTYKAIAVNLLEGEQLRRDYLKLNPSGQVPTLVLAGESYSESMAILEWLEECYPLPSLLPQDSTSRLRVRQLCQTIVSGTQPLQNLSAQRFYSSETEAQRHYAQHWIQQGLGIYERLISDTAGTFSFGGVLSLADLCLIPQCYNAQRFGVELQAFPRIAQIYSHCMNLPACRQSSPDNFAP